jgi:uncharacterized protein (DUF1697 family)
MSAYIALLRAVNVGGVTMKMAELRALAEDIGLAEVRTLLQSGNLVFRADAEAAALEARLEAEIAARMALSVAVMVRSAKAWARVVAANPFPDEAAADPGHLLVMPLKSAPTEGREAALTAAIKGRERARVIGDVAYLVYPDGVGQSKLTNAVIERQLGVRGTARNWNTAVKLAAMVAG